MRARFLVAAAGLLAAWAAPAPAQFAPMAPLAGLEPGTGAEVERLLRCAALVGVIAEANRLAALPAAEQPAAAATPLEGQDEAKGMISAWLAAAAEVTARSRGVPVTADPDDAMAAIFAEQAAAYEGYALRYSQTVVGRTGTGAVVLDLKPAEADDLDFCMQPGMRP